MAFHDVMGFRDQQVPSINGDFASEPFALWRQWVQKAADDAAHPSDFNVFANGPSFDEQTAPQPQQEIHVKSEPDPIADPIPLPPPEVQRYMMKLSEWMTRIQNQATQSPAQVRHHTIAVMLALVLKSIEELAQTQHSESSLAAQNQNFIDNDPRDLLQADDQSRSCKESLGSIDVDDQMFSRPLHSWNAISLNHVLELSALKDKVAHEHDPESSSSLKRRRTMWKKYGEKTVRKPDGQIVRRGYFRCNYPGCKVRKRLEHLPDGSSQQVSFHGEHNHVVPDAAEKALTFSHMP